MKWIKYIAASLFMLSSAVACEKSPTDEPDQSTGGELVLTSNVSEIFSNGKDEVEFTVKYNGSAVVATIKELGSGAVVENAKFTATQNGEYSFQAFYHDFESNVITINVVDAPALTLEVDKKTIYNTGDDICKFTVTYEGTDVTSEAIVECITNGYVCSEHTWSSTMSGEFEFRAQYNDQTSNVVKIKVEFPDLSNPLELTVDHARIAANGTDTATFTVLYEGNDVTADAKIKNVDSGEYLNGNTFTYSGSAKTVSFVAEYQDAVSHEINIGFGDFYKKVMLVRFTGTWCGPCTSLGQALKSVEANHPNRYAQICVHVNDIYSADDGVYFDRQFSGSSVPRLYYDYGTISQTGAIGISQIINDLNSVCEQNPAKVGIAATSVLDGDSYKLTVRLTAKEAGEYYLGVAVVEDGLIGTQSGVNTPYTHNDVLRALLTPIQGASVGTINENEEISREFSFKTNVGASDNLRVVMYVNVKKATSYYTTNSASCNAYGYLDYKFAE